MCQVSSIRSGEKRAKKESRFQRLSKKERKRLIWRVQVVGPGRSGFSFLPDSMRARDSVKRQMASFGIRTIVTWRLKIPPL